MKKNKRGMSGIVVTLILIGIALAAVGVVWYVLNNVIAETETEINQGTGDIFSSCAELSGTVTTKGANCGSGKENRIVGGEYCCVPI